MSVTGKGRTTLVSIAMLAGLSLLAVLHRRSTNEARDRNPDSPPGEAYSACQYGVTNTVYVGTQPLYAPAGLITESMRRDPVLKEELRKLGLGIKFCPFIKGHDVNMLSSEGFSESDVELVPMDVEHMIEALDSRTISAFAAWEPTPTIASQTHRLIVRFDLTILSDVLASFAAYRLSEFRYAPEPTTSGDSWVHADQLPGGGKVNNEQE